MQLTKTNSKTFIYDYLVYDIEEENKMIFKSNKIKDVVNFLGIAQSTISSAIIRNNVVKNKYKVVKIFRPKIVEVVMAYDMEDNERLVHMTNTTREMSEWFKVPIATIQSAIWNKSLLGRRYLIEKELVEA
jgi:hypothetical protein